MTVIQSSNGEREVQVTGNMGASVAPPRLAIAGVSGYAGGELVRLLLQHPRYAGSVPLLLGRPEDSGRTEQSLLTHLHPQITADESITVAPFSWERLGQARSEVLLLATPHDQSREWAPIAVESGMRVIDLSGAWRLQRAENRAVYRLHDHDPSRASQLQADAVYGSPELHKQAITSARLVANPGCYATSVILALAPLLRAGIVDLQHGVVCDAKSGVSGAGKGLSPKTHFMHAADNLSAYAVFGHRHTGELLEQLQLNSEQIQFTPHLLPIPRGILSTIYLRLTRPLDEGQIATILHAFYKDCPFVRVRENGVLPQIQHVVRTNFCDVGFELAPDGRRLVVVSCLDNLLKGAAGQAIQNLNLMCGWKETEGLL